MIPGIKPPYLNAMGLMGQSPAGVLGQPNLVGTPYQGHFQAISSSANAPLRPIPTGVAPLPRYWKKQAEDDDDSDAEEEITFDMSGKPKLKKKTFSRLKSCAEWHAATDSMMSCFTERGLWTDPDQPRRAATYKAQIVTFSKTRTFKACVQYDEAFRKHMFRREDVYDYSPAVNTILHANYLTDASTSLAYIKEMQACRDNNGGGGGGGGGGGHGADDNGDQKPKRQKNAANKPGAKKKIEFVRKNEQIRGTCHVFNAGLSCSGCKFKHNCSLCGRDHTAESKKCEPSDAAVSP